MNPFERVTAALSFEKPDRIPLWDVSHFDGFDERWRSYLGLDESATPRHTYGYDISIQIGDESFFPSRRRVLEDSGDTIVENDGWGRIVRSKSTGHFSQVLEYEFPTPKTFDRFLPDDANEENRFRNLEAQLVAAREHRYYTFTKSGGIYIRTHRLLPEEELLVKMILDPVFCRMLFGRVADHLTSMALETLKRTGTWNEGLWIYDDIAGTYAPMFHPDLFERYLLPLYSKMIETCRRAGCQHFYFHSDGNIGPVLDMLIEAGFEGFHPLEVRSGLGMVGLRERYGTAIKLFGGICNTEILPRGDLHEIEEHLRPLVELATDGGVVLGMASAGGDISPAAYDFCMKFILNHTRNNG